MTRGRVLVVGQCDADHASIRRLLEAHFAVAVDAVMTVADADRAVNCCRYDLVLVNRLVAADGSDGTELIRWMHANLLTAGVLIMLVSDHADAQRQAVADGAMPGFGKGALHASETLARLSAFLPRKDG